MGHHVSAIIGKKDKTNIEAIKNYQLAAAFESDFVIIFLETYSLGYWAEKLDLSIDSESLEIYWACPLVFFLAKEIGFEDYAIIQTDYFAGIGTQSASLYKNGLIVLEEKSINEVLKELGVKKGSSFDEFEAINLDKYRNSERYYYDSGNPAENMPNMIAGRIPEDQNGR